MPYAIEDHPRRRRRRIHIIISYVRKLEGHEAGTEGNQKDYSKDMILIKKRSVLPALPHLLCFYSHFARQIDVCLMRNLQNRFVGTVHILTDHPDAVVLPNRSVCDGGGSSEPAQAAAHHCVHDTDNSWVDTNWRPPVVKGLEAEIEGEKAGTKR